MTLAERLVRLTLSWLPPNMRGWGEAMATEAGTISGLLPSLFFAGGCIGFAARLGLAVAVRHSLMPVNPQRPEPVCLQGRDLFQGRGLTLICAFLATALGIASLLATDAPHLWATMNAAAFVAGVVTVLPLIGRAPADRPFFGLLALLTGASLLLTAGFGVEIAGARRWVSVGPIVLQPSLVLLPLLVTGFARSRDALTACGIVMAAIALALQPDAIMLGAMLAGLSAVVVLGRDRLAVFCLTVACIALAIACFSAASASDALHALATPATAPVSTGTGPQPIVWIAAILVILPAGCGMVWDRDGRTLHATFGATWSTLIVAGLVTDFPAPLIAYGGSSIVGYILCMLALPLSWRRTPKAAAAGLPDQTEPDDGRLQILAG